MIDSLIVFAASLLIGAVGIYAGAKVVVDAEDYTYAIVTALIGAVVWAIVGFFFGWIPLLGPLLVFVAYLAVINTRYPGGWVDAAAITIIAWVSVLVVLYVLALVGVTGFEAVGVPGV
ncbi:hypothetical protein [Natronobacterium gregoryi]|uniref:Uncharacterized protein n=2 Tax=Natronobacterium gregoryi TaxID=44930 RepID=L0AJS7_NATGS|nr:hypothetical protein [Natronobacterium gregoryi]AFZ74128.1 hypothetical protein Natgr_2993 [Natronobacterium gregoryi SP2]ELY63865.1 hypothetical protein C490_15067 [Natronobacterium gregoryi SP2]PLK22077.1 hypothetical protein CYV19_01415 [Natronobacterium gregoryi SP2]SFI49975.1 hypothetical protein SAMN05443661_10113 [Natronobacterium gregoryi]